MFDPEPVLTEYMVGVLVWGRIWLGVEVRLIPDGYGSAVGILVGGVWLGWWRAK